MKAVAGIAGVDLVSVNMKEKTLTFIGNMDLLKAVGKVKKLCRTEIESVGPAEEAKKKEEPKKEPKKEEAKKEEPKKEPKKEEAKKGEQCGKNPNVCVIF
ncbi:hypothetical protein K1719_004220 [Acacia pycnantha]|nr:hypothetical protein K1719_004220 [Acacia pycnantha]